MTISIVPVRVTDRVEVDRIEAYLAARSDTTPFHRPVWMAAIERACGHQAHYLLAVDGDGAVQGLLPLHDVRSPLFGRALVSTGFAVGGGIVAETTEIAEKLAEAGWILARRLSCPSLELRGGLLPKDAGWHVDRETYAGFMRPIAVDDEAILTAIPRKQRAEVRRALGLDMQIEIGREDADLDAHYRVYSESVRNLGTPVFPKRLFAIALDAFGNDADILTVRHQGTPVASVLTLYHRGTVMPYWGGGTKRARELRANDLMYFALMRHARERGCGWFDFGRSKTGTGAFAFKKNWGFEPAPLPYAIRTADGAIPRAINPLDPKYRFKVALWRRLPMFAANSIGPLIARGLG
jgi:FemAB-related protein (PEP-CTERM system-associated)